MKASSYTIWTSIHGSRTLERPNFHLFPATDLTMLCTLLGESPRQLPVFPSRSTPCWTKGITHSYPVKLITAPLRKHLLANFKMPPVDPTAAGQLRSLPNRHIATPLQPAPQPALGRRHQNITPKSPGPDKNNSSGVALPLAAYTHQDTPINIFWGISRSSGLSFTPKHSRTILDFHHV